MSIATFADVPIGELAALAVGLGVSGLLAGTVAGLLGVGGGIVLVPVLYQTLGILGIDESVRMPLAVGTSLATIIPTSIRSTLSHNARAPSIGTCSSAGRCPRSSALLSELGSHRSQL